MSRPPKKGGLSPNEEDLWKRVTRTVRPLARLDVGAARETTTPSVRDAMPVLRVTSSKPLAKEAAPKPAAKRGPLADRSPEKRVRRGKLEVGAKLDLHGFTQEEARAVLTRFLLHAIDDGVRVALVVTGKGGRLRSGETAPGVLKQKLPDWLAGADLRPLVSGYALAHQRHGGGGAYYVFLRAGAAD